MGRVCSRGGGSLDEGWRAMQWDLKEYSCAIRRRSTGSRHRLLTPGWSAGMAPSPGAGHQSVRGAHRRLRLGDWGTEASGASGAEKFQVAGRQAEFWSRSGHGPFPFRVRDGKDHTTRGCFAPRKLCRLNDTGSGRSWLARPLPCGPGKTPGGSAGSTEFDAFGPGATGAALRIHRDRHSPPAGIRTLKTRRAAA